MALPALRPLLRPRFAVIQIVSMNTRANNGFNICARRFQSTSSASSNNSPTLDSYVITPQQLSSALRKNIHSKLSTAPRIIPLCAAWFMPNDPEGRTGQQSFLAARIPRARFFDLDEVKDDSSPYPHMLPSPEVFASAMGKLGIRRDDAVVVYDTQELGIFSAPRVAWTLKVFGHQDTHILNNFKLWVEQGFPVEKGEPEDKIEETTYPVPELDRSKVVGFEEMRERALERGKEGAEQIMVLDARSKGRFDGTEPEPREGLSSGHVPGSVNIPFTDLLNARTKAFLPPSELKLYFETRDVVPKLPLISTCGTGVTACVIDAALAEAGYPDADRKVYDGSWTEWAQRVKPQEGLIKKSE